ncbi:MAG TPA: flagellar hook basal-body protein, partial [Pirellulaceae bacterium]|nr:flagellar hook basal-body protein [Pirellulaceae bacterium]
MIVGSYGELALIRGLGFLAEKQAAIANNLANVDTTSFKRRVAVAQDAPAGFQSMLDEQLPVVAYTEQTDFGRGIVRATDNRFDLAVDGPYWLKVRNNQGASFYTRNGQLQIDGQGVLVTRDGLEVLDQGGQAITIGYGEEAPSDLQISPTGQLRDPKSGNSWGPLALVSLPKPEALVPIGKGLYVDPENQSATQAGDGLRQGFLEGSNVD